MKKNTLGLGAFALFALILLLGTRFGPGACARLGLDAIVRRPLPVLMYHHVVEDGEETNEMTVTVSRLRKDFQYLHDRGFSTLLPRDLVSGEAVPERAVMITFDDGYRSNYDLLFPLLEEYGVHALICPIGRMTDEYASEFCSWRMYREMEESGWVEVGSHTWNLHNMDGRGGVYTPGGTNGIQALPGESDEAFRARVLDDIQKSYDRISEELGHPPLAFSYPYGLREPRAEALINRLFPVTFLTLDRTADLSGELHNLPRRTVTMERPLSAIACLR